MRAGRAGRAFSPRLPPVGWVLERTPPSVPFRGVAAAPCPPEPGGWRPASQEKVKPFKEPK